VICPGSTKCGWEYTREDGGTHVCPESGHERSRDAGEKVTDEGLVVTDANGNRPADGDTVAAIKDLRGRGSSLVVQADTGVKNIRLVDGDHDIDCRIDGVGVVTPGSRFVK
jgi:protein PhnA